MILKALRQPQKVTKISVLGFCILFLGFAFLFPDFFKEKLGELTVMLLQNFGFFYLTLGFLSVILLFVLAFSKWGEIRFRQEKPVYSWFSWIAMLYSTGMGAGLLLRAVQEPVFYFQNPPRSSILSTGDFALQYTFFHWGLTPWAFYGLFGLIMAYVLYLKKAAALSSSLLSGEVQYSFLAVLMNVLTIVCTLLGVVAALGLGSRQLLEAIGFLGDIPTNAFQAVMAVIVITVIATTSALLGMQKGIKNLSNFNLSLATVLLISVAILSWSGGVQFGFLNILGNYVYEFASMSLNLGNHQVGIEFLQDWTYFYWAFWLAWAPFTGVFIARISKGRSIREFVLAVLIVPALGTFIWFTIFGQSAFHLIQSGKASFEDFQSIYTGLFIFLDYFPWAGITKIIGLVLVFTFLITSVDSAIYVLSMFTDRGNVEPSKTYRLFWGLMIGLFTIGLILIGKEALLEAVSQMLIVFAFPFSLMFLGMAAYFVIILIRKK